MRIAVVVYRQKYKARINVAERKNVSAVGLVILL
jgi:hypothetical protein